MKSTRQIIWHSAFWLIMIGFIMFIGSTDPKNTLRDLVIRFVVYGLINISIFYTNFLVLLPRLLNRKRYFRYVLAMIAIILVVSLVKYMLARMFGRVVLMRNGMSHPLTFAQYYLSAVFTTLMFFFLSAALRFGLDWFRNDRIRRELENEKLSAELAFLKSQINPHFLFNSLNNIYSLAYQKSESTPEAVLKLSEIMRYMLYESNDKLVDMDKEIGYLRNYIDLQKLRFGNRAAVEMRVAGETSGRLIAPMILVSFVENAFKHGLVSDTAKPIIIDMTMTRGMLDFTVHNAKSSYNKDKTGGIGLVNVRRRLELLYPGRYTLKVDNEMDNYTTHLTLKLEDDTVPAR
ncbi:MAG: sensor histidine kinase [Mucilaginibacter polytrichastri]|nr:sensor histidine kinase [Mucilaginibacter polytrichastri]